MKQNILRWEYAVMIVLLAVIAIIVWSPLEFRIASGSTLQGNDYQATTTTSVVSGEFLTNTAVLKTGQGSLAQVTITGANTGVLVFYDATTSDVTKRASNKASTTIAIAEFPASATAGTYTFDAGFTDGLLISRLAGSGPTSTVMWR